MDQVGEELGHLELSEVLAPPEVAGASVLVGEDGGEEVVAVHNDVHPAVEGDAEVGVTAGSLVGDPPEDKAGGGVVIDVEERDLGEVALEKHDEGVEELVVL